MQFTFLRSLRAHSVLLLATAILFTTGCEDDDHDHDHDEDHNDANGFVLETEAGVENTYSLSVGTTNNSGYTFYLNRCVSRGGGSDSYENGCTVMTAMEITR